MKHNFRIVIGMLLLAIPLCINAQVQPTRPNGQVKAEPKKEKAEKPEMPEKKDNKGGVDMMPKVSGFVQGLYQANLSDEGELKDNTFRMRRVRLSVSGNLAKGLTYKIQGDFGRSPILVDAFVKYKACNEFAIQVGQFKTPFTLESPINPVNLEIFDYGEGVKGLVGYNDVCGVGALGRDIGIMATGGFLQIEDKAGKSYNVVDYAVGVFNGNGVNVIDNNNRKDIVGHIELHPGMKALTLSGSYYYGMYKSSNDADAVATGETNLGHGARNRWTAGAQYNDGNLVVRGEYISGQTGFQAGTTDEFGSAMTEDRFLTSNGYYGVLGYNLRFGKEGKKQTLMPVIRYEHFAKDANIEKGGTNWYTVGINYWPVKSLNFKLDYSLVQKESGSNSHRVVGILSYKF